jgi:hypothetical protein
MPATPPAEDAAARGGTHPAGARALAVGAVQAGSALVSRLVRLAQAPPAREPLGAGGAQALTRALAALEVRLAPGEAERVAARLGEELRRGGGAGPPQVSSAAAADMLADLDGLQWRGAALPLVGALWARALERPGELGAGQVTLALRCVNRAGGGVPLAGLDAAAARLQELAAAGAGLAGVHAREALFSLTDLGWRGGAGGTGPPEDDERVRALLDCAAALPAAGALPAAAELLLVCARLDARCPPALGLRARARAMLAEVAARVPGAGGGAGGGAGEGAQAVSARALRDLFDGLTLLRLPLARAEARALCAAAAAADGADARSPVRDAAWCAAALGALAMGEWLQEPPGEMAPRVPEPATAEDAAALAGALSAVRAGLAHAPARARLDPPRSAALLAALAALLGPEGPAAADPAAPAVEV